MSKENFNKYIFTNFLKFATEEESEVINFFILKNPLKIYT